jgi:phosphatidylserine decarboxylase
LPAVECGSDIDGALHSVNPIELASGVDVFGGKKRSYTLIETKAFGTLCFVEVGAFGVGSIVNTRTAGAVETMNEKGFSNLVVQQLSWCSKKASSVLAQTSLQIARLAKRR